MIIIKFSGKEFQIPASSAAADDEEINNEKDDGLTDGEIPKTLGELRDLIANKTGCDQSTMKLLRKGKFIVLPLDEPIENLKFKDKEKIMVIGASKKDSGFELLEAYEKNNLPKLSDLYKNIDQDLTQLERNFLQGDMLKEMLGRMDKRIREFTERSLQHLESIDALNIYDDNITDEQKQRNREKRKSMIDGIQTLLRDNDKNSFRLQQYRKSLEFPDL